MARDREDITVAPDGRPVEEQPQWRKDFAIDSAEDNYVARRDFAKFLVLTSGAFVAGQGLIAAQSLLRAGRAAPHRMRVGSLRALSPGTATTFNFPGPHDACLLLRTPAGTLLAYSQKCTHLSCAVVPRMAEGVLHCPCHNGYFEAAGGRPIAGPPRRPLPLVTLEVQDGAVYATGFELRTV